MTSWFDSVQVGAEPTSTAALIARSIAAADVRRIPRCLQEVEVERLVVLVGAEVQPEMLDPHPRLGDHHHVTVGWHRGPSASGG